MVRQVFGYSWSFVDSVGKVILNGIGINVEGVDSVAGECYVNVFVDDPLPDDERIVVVSQEVPVFGKGGRVLGYMQIAVKSGHRCFAMNAGVQQTTQSECAMNTKLAIRET